MPMLAFVCSADAAELERLLERLARSAAATAERASSVGVVGEQHGELVAAEPGDGVGLPRARVCSRRLISISRRSPWSWPSASLTSLNWSRSITQQRDRVLGGARRALQRVPQPVVEQRAVRGGR